MVERNGSKNGVPAEGRREIKNLRDDLNLAKGHRVRYATYASCVVLAPIAFVCLYVLCKNPDSPPLWAINLISLITTGAIAYLFAAQNVSRDDD